jgi:arachidonate 15-lipoxygenase
MTNKNPQDPALDQKYEYYYDRLAEISSSLKYPMVASIFFEDNSLAKEDWVKDVATLLLRIRSNQAMYDVAINEDRCSTLKLIFDIRLFNIISNPKRSAWIREIFNLLISILKKLSFSPKQPAPIIVDRGLDGYLINEQIKLIQNKKIAFPAKRSQLKLKDYQDLFQIIYLPNIANRVQEDNAFAEQRLAGANPIAIERLRTRLAKFPITDPQYQSVMGTSDSLQTALDEHRLYITDYQVLQEIVPGSVQIGTNTVQKYIYHPIALFAVEQGNCPNRRLVPIAIQCYQDPAPDNPIFVAPSLHSSASERWAWQIAKLTVQIADANYHEFISHLGGTHLRMEIIAISTYRQLPITHPLGILLRPHLEGTLFINDAAVNGLVNHDGTVDKVAAGTLESSLLLSVKGAQNYPFLFNESSLPMTLKSRGVDDLHCLPNYPYRDDALLIWDAINEWVSSYLKLFYLDDISVQTDPKIQAWIQDLTDPQGGQTIGIGEKVTDDAPAQIQTLTYLIEAVTLIIFTGSAAHAAVNFPQASLMAYVPNMPLAGYRPAPTTTEGIDETHYLDILPPLSQAENQMNMTYLLGSLYSQKLGDYGDSYFKDSRVKPILQAFQSRLKQIELEINTRNEVRCMHYDFLLPSRIPQSINI